MATTSPFAVFEELKNGGWVGFYSHFLDHKRPTRTPRVTLLYSLNPSKAEIKEAVAIFSTINDPPGIQGLMYVENVFNSSPSVISMYILYEHFLEIGKSTVIR